MQNQDAENLGNLLQEGQELLVSRAGALSPILSQPLFRAVSESWLSWSGLPSKHTARLGEALRPPM